MPKETTCSRIRLFHLRKPLSALAIAATLFATQLPALAISASAPVMTGYTVSTNHSSDLVQHSTDPTTGQITPVTDDQYMDIDVTFSKPIQAAADAASDLAVTLAGGTTGSYINPAAPDDSNQDITDSFSNHITATANGNTLHIVFHYGFAQYNGQLTVKPAATDGSITKITSTDGTPVQWTNISCIAPNGVQLSTVSQTPADPTADAPASVTKKVITPTSATRAMVFYVFLKNGQPVGTFSPMMGSFVAHYHLYLTMDAPTYTSEFPSSFNAKYGSQYTMTTNGDTFTITSNKNADGTVADTAGDVLDVLVYAYPRDRNTNSDKTALNAAIAKADALTAANYTAASYAPVEKQLSIASAMNNSIYYLQSEVDAQTAALNTATDNLVTIAQQQAVDDFIATVSALPATVTLQDATLVSSLAATYAGFTNAQKTLVPSATLQALQTAQSQIQALENPSASSAVSSSSSSTSSNASSLVVSNPNTGEGTTAFVPAAVFTGVTLMLLVAGSKKRRS